MDLATVVTTSPLTVRLDGASVAVPAKAPAPAPAPALNDRVRVEALRGQPSKLYVLGPA